MKTGDLSLVRKINKSIVLTKIQEEEALSRARISEITGLNKATVSSLVAELIADHLVCETGLGESSGGRKPVMLYFNKSAGYSIGIDLGVNYIFGILTDLSGSIIFEYKTDLLDSHLETVLSRIIEVIQILIKQMPPSPYGIIGIGIGVPGITDINDNILFAPNLKWENVDLKTYLEEYFNIPITVNNEANAGAHGEKLYGAGVDIPNFVYTSIGIGIGTGIIINNELYKGASGVSGESGHFTIHSEGLTCSCGNKGCWELYASEKALLTMTKDLQSIKKSHEEISLEELVELARDGNEEVLNLFHRIGEYIGIGFVNISNMFNPNAIIIGNRFSIIKEWILEPIHRVVTERLSRFQQVEIKFSKLGLYSSALGSSAFAIENFFSKLKVTVG